jgi:cytohesin
MARALIEAGADVNLDRGGRETPLYWAAFSGRTEMVRVLVGAGAEINLANRYGDTPLICAATYGRTETVKALLEAGADVNLANRYGYTPLYWAAEQGHLDIVRLLLDAGADVNLAHRDQYTPLYWAAEKGHLDIVRLLLDAGADVNQKNIYGYTPLSSAAKNGHVEIVRLLKEEISSQKRLRASLYDVKANDKAICERLTRLHTIDLDDEEKGDHQLLFHMAKRGFIQAFDFLMARSMPDPQARPYNLPGDDINRLDEEGHTALYHAVQQGQVEMVKHILNKYQPDLTIQENDYETLLKLANPLIQLELSRYKINNPTFLAQAFLLLSAGVGKQNDKQSNHPGHRKF